MRIAICDDSAIDRDIACDLLRGIFEEKRLRPDLVPYESGIDLLYEIQDGTVFDIVFLDIYMTDHLGIDIAHRLRALGYGGEIVFLTSSPEFAIDSYDVSAAGYILKPISAEKLARVVGRIIQGFDEKTYPVRQRANVLRIPLSEILYVESSNTKCVLHRSDGTDYNIYKRLDEIETELAEDKRFLRCHQSYLVNMDHVQQVDKQFLLDSGATVFIRQRNLRTIRQIYQTYTAEKSSAGAEALPAENG